MADLPFISFADAVERLSQPDVDLNTLRAELATVLTGITDGKFGYDPKNKCQGLVLWRDPDDPSKMVKIRNHIISCVDGAHYSTTAQRLWQVTTSHEEPPVRIDIGNVFPGEGKDFEFFTIQKDLEEIVGCPLSSSVKYGFDGFFHYVFERQFRVSDRQRMKVEQIVTYMQQWDLAMGSSAVLMSTGRIEVVCQLFPKELRDKERERKAQAVD